MSIDLFLDFDGVTHPEPCFAENVFCRLHLIESVLAEFPSVRIIVSSSWRDHYPLEKLRLNFSPSIGERVIAVTPNIKRPSPAWLPGPTPQYERQWEIEAWMEENRHWGARWVAIDDRDYWFSPGCENLLLTSSETGFLESDQVVLRQMIVDRL